MVMQRFGGWIFLILLIALASMARAHHGRDVATAEDKAVTASARR